MVEKEGNIPFGGQGHHNTYARRAKNRRHGKNCSPYSGNKSKWRERSCLLMCTCTLTLVTYQSIQALSLSFQTHAQRRSKIWKKEKPGTTSCDWWTWSMDVRTSLWIPTTCCHLCHMYSNETYALSVQECKRCCKLRQTQVGKRTTAFWPLCSYSASMAIHSKRSHWG